MDTHRAGARVARLRRRSRIRGLVGALLAGVLGALPASAEVPRVALILDASGSMWARLEGSTKIEVARDAIRDLATDWEAEVELGLVAYGHRSRRKCDDIQTLVPPGGAPRRIVEAVQSVRPNGMTPIGASLRHTAEEMGHRQRPVTLVLVSDGNETCDLDPCEVARALEREGAGFTTHVIGFDVTEEERAQLACVADATGGLFLTAQGADSLRTALESAFERAARGGPPPLWLAASLSGGSAPLARPLAWTLRRLEDGAPGAVALEAESAELVPDLPDGRYRVEARLEGLSASADVVMTRREPRRKVLVLDAGQVDLSGVDKTGHPIDAGLVWRARRVDEPGKRSGPVFAEASGGSVRWLLPAGRWWLSGARADGEVGREVVLRPGQQLRKRFQFGLGKLSLHAVLADGRPPLHEPLRWRIEPLDRGPERAAIEVERPTVLRTLEVGRYRVRAMLGHSEASRVVEVRTGVTASERIELAAGRLQAYGALPPPGGVLHDALNWRVFRLDREAVAGQGGNRPFARTREAAPTFVLPAGRYRVRARLADGRTAEGERVVEAGVDTRVRLTFDEAPPAALP